MRSAVLVAIGCGGGEVEDGPTGTDGASSFDCGQRSGARVGDCAGDFSLPTAAGGRYRLVDQRGRTIVVHVAALGSEIDREASAFIEASLADGAGVVAVDVLARDELAPPLDGADAIAWRDGLALSYPVAYDPDDEIAEIWAETSLFPTILVIAPDGTVAARIHEQYETQLPAALAGR